MSFEKNLFEEKKTIFFNEFLMVLEKKSKMKKVQRGTDGQREDGRRAKSNKKKHSSFSSGNQIAISTDIWESHQDIIKLTSFI